MIDYKFYTDTYQGCSISADEWLQLEPRAAEQLAQYKRMYTVTPPEETSEAMAVCAMAEVMAYIAAAQNGTGAVASASIGSVSVNYASPSGMDLSRKGQARELYQAAHRYLDIYRG